MGPVEAALLAPLVVVAVLAGVALGRPAGGWGRGRAADRWMDRRQLPHRADVRALVAAHLRRTAICRLAGGVGGAAVALAVGATPFGGAAGGYVAGAIVAAALAPPLVPGAPQRRARLQARTPAGYLPTWAWRLWRALPIAAVVLVAADAVIPLRTPSVGAAYLAGQLAVVAVVAVAVVAGQRRILRRPQPVVDDVLVRADDAQRSAALRGLTGAGMAALGMVCADLLWSLGAADVQLLRWVAPWLGLAALLGGMVAWVRLAGDADTAAPAAVRAEAS